MAIHLDTDFLVHALSSAGPERQLWIQTSDSGKEIQISSIVWYEFTRGPRTPEQISVARQFFTDDGIIPFSEELAGIAADVFRSLGSPRKRAADIAIGVTAVSMDATLLTHNKRDFAGIPELKLEVA